MAQSATMDDRGRILLPIDARRKAGIKANAKLLIEVQGAGVIQLKDYNALTRKVQKIATKKLQGWKEEEHKEDKLLLKLSRNTRIATD
jgi:bifunctional DNA-binding transcriptional regulator/antitoxin component of YhaV-PrlF toxin-antitoxin module